jgi:hypothetical protein
MKITKESEKKYGMACKVCQLKCKEEIEPSKRHYYIGCPFRCIDNEYCPTIEELEKQGE